MPIEAIIVCALAIAAFTTLGVTLAWAHHRTTRG